MYTSVPLPTRFRESMGNPVGKTSCQPLRLDMANATATGIMSSYVCIYVQVYMRVFAHAYM